MNLTTMNIKSSTPFLTMTSREIAEYTGKEHKNILADIRTMLDELGKDAAEFSAACDVPGPYGRLVTIPIFRLPKRETMILVSGYSVTLRAKIVDRWQELEASSAPQAPAIPTTLVEALTLALENAKQMEAQKLQIAAQSAAITALQPMATVGERVAQHEHTLEQIVRTFPGVHINKIKAGLLLLKYFYKSKGTYRVYRAHSRLFTENFSAHTG
jgi:phage regulator Rha-like protein